MSSISNIYKKIKGYLNNTLWIIGDKFVTLGVTFLVTVIIARYLGPKDYGTYAYVMSMISLFSVAGHMGLSGLVVREIVKHPEQREVTLGTTFILKQLGMLVGYIALIIYAYIYEGLFSVEFNLIAVGGVVLLLRGFEIIDFWFNAFIQAKYVSASNVISNIVSALFKVFFALSGFGVIYLILSNILQAILAGLLLLIFYIKNSTLKIKTWKFSLSKAKSLLSESWLLYLGSILAIVNLKIDQVMLRWYQGLDDVGIYAVAVQLSEAWYFIPVAIVASFYPKLINLREKNIGLYYIRLQQLFSGLFLIALIVAIFINFIAEPVVKFFYGVQYVESASVLVIHIWAAIFIFMRSLFSKWIMIESAVLFSLLTHGLGTIVNVGLNYIWIKKYGVTGAAYATLISYACSSFIALLFYKKTRPIFWMMCKAFYLKSLTYNKT